MARKSETKATSKYNPATDSVMNAIQVGVIRDLAAVSTSYRDLQDRLRPHGHNVTEDGVLFDDETLDTVALDELVASIA
jgi:virulence-associated protein VapD